MRRSLLCFIFVIFISRGFSQQTYKEIDLDGNTHILSAIELSPDGKTLAIGTSGGPVILWEMESKKVLRKIDLSGYEWGPYFTYSSDGKFLLLQQQFFTDWKINKDKPNRAEVLDIGSGKILITKDNVHSACFSADNKSLVTLQDGEVIFWNIQNSAEERKFKPANATNAIAMSPDGNLLVVSQKPTEEDLKNIPSVRNDKKAIKEALKYLEVAVFYDAKTLERKYIANDVFDIVFSMRFSGDGQSLYLFNAPNSKRISTQGGASRHGYIQAVNSSDGNVSRIIYSTNASEPQYKESSDGKYFASTSIEQKFYVLNTVVVFDKESGSMLKNFQNDFRISENKHWGRATFEFLPDHKTIALGYGNKLALWEFEK